MMMAEAAPAAPEYVIQYSSITGCFLQDDLATDPLTFDYAKVNLGLINRSYPTDEDLEKDATQWQKFEHYVRTLNLQAPSNVQYKFIILGRHGEGYHNVAEAKYGTAEWDRYWSRLEGDGTLYWSDSHLTKIGEGQALYANEFWRGALSVGKIPAPESYYVSPLDRCCHTANLTFGGLDLPADKPFRPLIKELVRETLGIHTCDRRSTKTQIMERWPDFRIEPHFSEQDLLWDPEVRETLPELVVRMGKLYKEIFTNDMNSFISVTAHSGMIEACLVLFGHRPFPLLTGSVIPVLVKAERVAVAPEGPTETQL